MADHFSPFGFVEFIRRQGIVGLAIGFILGGAVSKVVSAMVQDIINPLLSLVLGVTEELKNAKIAINQVEIRWGDFVSNLIDFFVIAVIVYFGFKGLGLDRLDIKKEAKLYQDTSKKDINKSVQ